MRLLHSILVTVAVVATAGCSQAPELTQHEWTTSGVPQSASAGMIAPQAWEFGSGGVLRVRKYVLQATHTGRYSLNDDTLTIEYPPDEGAGDPMHCVYTYDIADSRLMLRQPLDRDSDRNCPETIFFRRETPASP